MEKQLTVVITGASAGVGRSIVRALSHRRWKFALLSRNADGLEEAVKEARRAGSTALPFPIDVADAAAIENVADQIEKELGSIDVWINNAMVSVFSPVRDMTPEEYKRVTDVTYLGAVYGTQTALRRMIPRDSGLIVQVGSSLAYRSIPLQSAYCAAKHALQAFTESLRSELIHDGSKVRVTMVELPALNTPQFDWARNKLPNRLQPIPPIYQPELAADAIAWAIDHAPRELKLGWSTLLTIWLNKIFPGWIDVYLARIGYKGQQAVEPKVPGAPDNLWAPVPGDHGAHGRFDDQAKTRSTQFWLRTHPAAGVLALLGIVSLACGYARTRK